MNPAARRRTDSGVALLTTLLVLVLIVALVFEIFRLGARAAQSGAYARDSLRAAILAEAGAAAAKGLLKLDGKNNDYDSLDEFWAQPLPATDLGDGTVSVTVEDEERKINLNYLMAPKGNALDERAKLYFAFQQLLKVLDLDPSIAEAVVDWMDVDDNPRSGGAESSYYLSLPFPYRAKNDLFDTVEELRLVRGVTPEVFEKLKPFVTIYPTVAEQKQVVKVNVNTAPKEVLMALCGGQIAEALGPMSEGTANEIVEYRKDHHFAKTDDIRNASPYMERILSNSLQGPAFLARADVKSTAFRVRSSGTVFGTVRTVDAVGIRAGTDIQWRSWRLE